ncbi:uncharacterized protein DS421_15g501390 [Arachis hypogaea]|nr:uncharacterized protein DS421_15g501390 [Arachis hypogaea]
MRSSLSTFSSVRSLHHCRGVVDTAGSMSRCLMTCPACLLFVSAFTVSYWLVAGCLVHRWLVADSLLRHRLSQSCTLATLSVRLSRHSVVSVVLCRCVCDSLAVSPLYSPIIG